MIIYSKAIDNAGPYAITPRGFNTKRIEVRENSNSTNAPTADLNQFDQNDSAGANGCRVAKGTSAIFTTAGRYTPLDPVPAGFINTAAGSITISVIEHESI